MCFKVRSNFSGIKLHEGKPKYYYAITFPEVPNKSVTFPFEDFFLPMHTGLFGTFCFSKGKKSFCLSLLKLQNVPNKPACMFICHIRVPNLPFQFTDVIANVLFWLDLVINNIKVM